MHAKQLQWYLRIFFLIEDLPPRCFLILGPTLQVSSNCVFKIRRTHWSGALKELALGHMRKYFTDDGPSYSLRKAVTSPPPFPQILKQKQKNEASFPPEAAMNTALIVSKNSLATPDRSFGLVFGFRFFKKHL